MYNNLGDQARGLVRAAEGMALRHGHQPFTPEHILRALLDDPEGLAADLIARAGGRLDEVAAGLALAIERMPKLAPATARVLGTAESLARKAGDSLVGAEQLLLAIVVERDSEASRLLSGAGITPAGLDRAIGEILAVRAADAAPAGVDNGQADHAPTVIKIGGLIVDIDNETVEANGLPVPLTDNEYRMLELLSRRKGKTITKAMLLGRLYGGVEEPEHRIINVFICKLRKKLAAATGGRHLIETVWGRGYVLCDPEALPPSPGGVETSSKSPSRVDQARAKTSKAGLVAFGNCVLDLAARTLRDMSGRGHALSRIEVLLLQAFIDHPNQDLNRDELARLAYGRTWSPLDRSLDIRISRLRRKIEPDPARPQVLRTVRGVGYRYDDGAARSGRGR